MSNIDDYARGPIVYGVKDGRLVHISEVTRGIDCGCMCSACGKRLIAKKGQLMVAHFAHENGENCKNGYETQLHLLAKRIIFNNARIRLPPQVSSIESIRYGGIYTYPQDSTAGDWITIEKAWEECRVDDIIPDIIIQHDGGQLLLVEIFVTNRIDEDKKRKIINLDIPTVEIDLSSFKIDNNDPIIGLEDDLINKTSIKKWIHVKDLSKRSRLMNRYLECWKIRSWSDWRSKCPRKYEVRQPEDENVIPCELCSYHMIGINQSKNSPLYHACIGDYGRISDEELKNRLLADIHEILVEDTSKQCSCGGKFVKRRGKYSVFWGCTNYPICKASHNTEAMFHRYADYVNNYRTRFCCPVCGNILEKGFKLKEGTTVNCSSPTCGFTIVL